MFKNSLKYFILTKKYCKLAPLNKCKVISFNLEKYVSKITVIYVKYSKMVYIMIIL